jgi:hypothetical protein
MTTALALPVYDSAALAQALKDMHLPGQRSKTAITKLRRQRRNYRESLHATGRDGERRGAVLASLARRADARVLARYTAEVGRRGGEVAIDSDSRSVPLAVADRKDGLALLTASGWRKYGRQGHRYATLAYLCGREDGQTWAARVPGTITTVSGALYWLEPAAVRDARLSGRRVARQGDVYAVETRAKAHDGKGELPESHIWDAEARVLAHPQHGTLSLPYPVRFIPQNAYGMGRGAGRAFGD